MQAPSQLQGEFRGPRPINLSAMPLSNQQPVLGGVKPQPSQQAATVQPSAAGNQQVTPATTGQQYGLSGYESAMQGGMLGGLNALQHGNQLAAGAIGQGVSALGGARASSVDPMTGQKMFTQAAEGVQAYSPAGLQAQQQQAALSGALGADAQQQAFSDFMSSPGQEFLRQQGEQSLINQAAALGGLGGGEVRKRLAEYGTGMAAQDFQNQFNRLGQLSGQGLQAAGMGGQFLSQAGQQMGNLAAQNAQMQTQANLAKAQGLANLYGQQAGIGSNLASQAANIYTGTGSGVGQARLQAGRDIAGNIGSSTSALANLANQQGSGLSDIIGSGGSNLANLLSGSGTASANQMNQLGQILANLSVGSGTNVSNLQSGTGQAQYQAQMAEKQDKQQAVGTAAGILASMFSDERLKDDVAKIGSVNGYNLYSWTYNDKTPDKSLVGKRYTGVMADEVEKINPEVVTLHSSGYKMVNYNMLEV